jgi:hypothetical protein
MITRTIMSQAQRFWPNWPPIQLPMCNPPKDYFLGSLYYMVLCTIMLPKLCCYLSHARHHKILRLNHIFIHNSLKFLFMLIINKLLNYIKSFPDFWLNL